MSEDSEASEVALRYHERTIVCRERLGGLLRFYDREAA
jgi:hypothetical protein